MWLKTFLLRFLLRKTRQKHLKINCTFHSCAGPDIMQFSVLYSSVQTDTFYLHNLCRMCVIVVFFFRNTHAYFPLVTNKTFHPSRLTSLEYLLTDCTVTRMQCKNHVPEHSQSIHTNALLQYPCLLLLHLNDEYGMRCRRRQSNRTLGWSTNNQHGFSRNCILLFNDHQWHHLQWWV